MKILLFTDSRGQHKPSDEHHLLFGERLASDRRLDMDLYLCPFKWTTTLDFIEVFPSATLLQYDAIILYSGIVDWSPRPLSSAINDLYNNKLPQNLGNLKINRAEYASKAVNNKKSIFDAVFGESSMRRHFDNPFDVEYENEKTINMYDLEMARSHLIPRLRRINNLIYISANRVIRGWNGDYWKERPENISIIHDYSDVFCAMIDSDNIVDLREWNEKDIKRYTSDNMHLTKAGNDYIYEKISLKLDLSAAVKLMGKSMKSTKIHHGLSNDGNIISTRSKVQTNVVEAPLQNEPRKLRAINSLIEDKCYKKALLAISESPDYFKSKTLLFNALYCSLKDNSIGHDNVLEKAKHGCPWTLLDESCADYNYIRCLWFIFSERTIKEIEIRNACENAFLTDKEFENIENKLSDAPDTLSQYLVDKEIEYGRRYDAEYKYINKIVFDGWPYNYLSSYKDTLFVPKRMLSDTKITLIYCIKNRSKRAKISLASLFSSYYEYAGRCLSLCGKICIKIDILLVEDTGTDMIESLPSKICAIDIIHYVVDTKTSWSRAGLLNYGIKRANGDIVSFCDVDFLFGKNFFTTLEKYICLIDFKKYMFAINCFETDGHIKEGKKISRLSPYGYMWFMDKELTLAVSGFDENYEGHGFEDRDLEHKLKKRFGVQVLSSFLLNPASIILHLSHNIRTGSEKRNNNRERYLSFLSGNKIDNTETIWGEFELIKEIRY